MIRNYYTLYKQCREFSVLRDCRLIECFSQLKNELIFHFFSIDSKSFFLRFSADSKNSHLVLLDKFSRAGKNSIDLLPEIIGYDLKSIDISGTDRIIYFDFGNFILQFNVFGGSKSNVLIIGDDSIVVNSFKNSTKLTGSKYTIKASSEISNQINRLDYIDKKYPKLGKYYSSEVYRRFVNLYPEKSLSTKYINLADEIANNLTSEILSSDTCYFLKNSNDEQILSLIKLADFPETVNEFDSVNLAVRYAVTANFRDNALLAKRNLVLKKLSFLKLKAEKQIAFSISDEPLERAEVFKLWAELLSARNDQKNKPGKALQCTDWNGNQITIPIKENETVLDASIRYFKKSKSVIKRLDIEKEIHRKTAFRLNKINSLLDIVNTIDNTKELDKLMKNNDDIFEPEMNDINEPASKFRKFDLGEGFTLYVGKNAANNDELTMHFAKPNDLWFHSRGTSGSHAVLRLDRNQKPPKEILKKAAAITAYYSGAKNSKYTPVAYTFKKFVHKPRGANPGAVVVSREDVIMVEPGLPKNIESGS